MIWVIIYAIMLHHHDSLRGSDKADYKCGVVDQFYGSLSYSGLAEKRTAMVFYISNPRFRGLDRWIPDPVQREWYKRAMALVAGQSMSDHDGSIEPIIFDTFDALCDEFITDA